MVPPRVSSTVLPLRLQSSPHLAVLCLSESAHSLVTLHTPRLRDGVITHTDVDFPVRLFIPGKQSFPLGARLKVGDSRFFFRFTRQLVFFDMMSWSRGYFSIF